MEEAREKVRVGARSDIVALGLAHPLLCGGCKLTREGWAVSRIVQESWLELCWSLVLWSESGVWRMFTVTQIACAFAFSPVASLQLSLDEWIAGKQSEQPLNTKLHRWEGLSL